MIERSKAIAQDAARGILIKTGSQSRPINVRKIIEDLGIIYLETDELEDHISGFIKRTNKDGQPIIVVNGKHPKERRRFTAAHELGHFLLHSMNDFFIDKNEEKILFRKKNHGPLIDIKEIQANNFAAELLMPSDLLSKDLGDSISLEEASLNVKIEMLSKKYDVSTQAMTIRIGSFLC